MSFANSNKWCPLCDKQYDADLKHCPIHNVVLVGSSELTPGTVFRNTYRIIRKLGQGGMGTVYLAEHILLQQLRALKLLSPGLSADAAAVQRFQREAKRSADMGFQNPNIVKTIDVGQEEDGTFFISMEYVDGPSLATLLEEFPNGLPVVRAIAIVQGIANGLREIHEKNAVHRDIKPSNILLAVSSTHEEIAKIADFGIVTGSQNDPRLTRSGWHPLTPSYAAPEQWRGDLKGTELDGRTDLYALGCLFYEMLTGVLPFRDTCVDGLCDGHLYQTPTLPSDVKDELKQYPGLDSLVCWMLKKSRDERPANVMAFLNALEVVATNKRFVQKPIPVLPVLPIQHRKSGRFPVWLAALLSLTVLAFSSWLIINWREVNVFPWDSTSDVASKANHLYKIGRYRDGVKLFANACKRGDLESCNNLGESYDAKSGSTTDYEIANALYKQACNGGFMGGCINLANSYYEAHGVKKDLGWVIFLYRRACDGGDMNGCFLLGRMLEDGDGTNQDYAQAAKLYQKGCDNNEGFSCQQLGGLYAEGHGVPKDWDKAKYYQRKGCVVGHFWCGN